MSAVPADRAPVTATAPARLALPRHGSAPGLVLAPADAVAAGAALAAAMLVGLIDTSVGWLLYVPAWVGVVALSGDYRLPGDDAERSRRLFRAAIALTVVAGIVAAASPAVPAPYPVLLLSGASAVLGKSTRRGVEALARFGVALPGLSQRVVLIGRERTVRDFLQHLEEHPDPVLDVVGTCLVGPVNDPALPLPTALGIAQCTDLVADLYADAVVVLPDVAVDVAATRRLQWQLADLPARLFLWPGVVDVAAARACLYSRHGLGLVHLRAPRIDGPAHRVKDAVEPVLAALLLVVVLPVIACLAVAVRRDSPGPALFRQVRIGREGVPFIMWKLRTMRMDAQQVQDELRDEDEGSGPLFKIREDPRTTRVGRWLRRTSLDELPQLLNVARGEMSLVGPRPALPDEVRTYDADARRRLAVRPGITGLWQVSGRSELSWKESVRLDQYYVDNWSPTADVVLLLRTVGAVVRRRGAY